MQISIEDLMSSSGVAFGTSGARGLVTSMTDLVCYAYTKAFLQYLEKSKQITGNQVAVGADLRPSSDRIAAACALGIAHGVHDDESQKFQVLNFGKVSSPALALYGMDSCLPTVMVTGSHIPDDRNGIKFTTPSGEITKSDERGIKDQTVEIPDGWFDSAGALVKSPSSLESSNSAQENYRARYRDFFGKDFLLGARVGVYQHSAVLRDELVLILQSLGASVTALGRSECFIPVDTEAIRPEDRALAHQWAAGGDFDTIVSVDGDSDRPLISDEAGNWLRGDVAGILCARFLGADSVVAPVSCNTALERCEFFNSVKRTMIGSPFVIEGMKHHLLSGESRVVVGYEANGGFLQASPITREGRVLKALPTRDAVIVLVAVLGLARQERKPISELLKMLPERYTYSERIKEVPTQASTAMIKNLNSGERDQPLRSIQKIFGDLSGVPTGVETTDGLRISFDSGEIIHLRPSGNAPELRCYTEADTLMRAEEINIKALKKVQQLIASEPIN